MFSNATLFLLRKGVPSSKCRAGTGQADTLIDAASEMTFDEATQMVREIGGETPAAMSARLKAVSPDGVTEAVFTFSERRGFLSFSLRTVRAFRGSAPAKSRSSFLWPHRESCRLRL